MDSVKLAILTSGGDAQGMNAAVRAVVRTALYRGASPFAVLNGWQGAVDGGESIRPLTAADVGNILHVGGTVIGTARCAAFRERRGRLTAAANLLAHGIDRLVVIGGDGSLTGTDQFRREWPELLAELVDLGELDSEVAQAHPVLRVAGLVGSIDNDLVGSETTIGADSALHRIVEAIDAIQSTAASHQRSFVIEVMGRHCGYLPLMAGIAGGCDYVFVPEYPPEDGWEDEMCASLRRGREAGRKDSIVLVAEGATDRHGQPIDAHQVREIIEQRLGEDTRETILGHVQRGGRPSAYDRWMSTLLGYHAALDVLSDDASEGATILGVHGNRIAKLPLEQTIANTRAVADYVQRGDYAAAVKSRGSSFYLMRQLFGLIADPPAPDAPLTGDRVALMHVGGLAPGMNPAVRAVVRFGTASGLTMLGVQGGVPGLIAGNVRELSWADVEGWHGQGGCELGTRRTMPGVPDLYPIARALENHQVSALIIIGGYNGYLTAHQLESERERYPAFQIPIVCIPASIDNNLPGTELSIGADSALNDGVRSLDNVRQSASAARRCFIAEVMGRRCGFLTLAGAVAAGAAQVYLDETGITLAGLAEDVSSTVASFESGRRFFMALRNEAANPYYTTDVLARIYEAESGGRFDVRQTVLGHVQQGGDPSPYDRVLATRLAAIAVDEVSRQLAARHAEGRYVGIIDGAPHAFDLDRMMDHLDQDHHRPHIQWWLDSLLPVLAAVRDLEPTGSRPV